ncbi:MAG: sensor histidine kinase [Flavobacteriales bacterium]|nr:sensor histidine kinase [Flavobacteriales bacterium]
MFLKNNFLRLIILYHIAFTYATKSYSISLNKYIGKELLIFADSSNNCSIQDLDIYKFHKSKSQVPNLGVTSYIHWAIFNLNIESIGEYIIHIQSPDFAKINLYLHQENDSFYEIPMYTSEIYPNYLIKSDSQKTYTIYIKITPNGKIQLPIKIYKIDSYHTTTNRRQLFLGILFGSLIALILYNFFLFSSTRSYIYLLYVFYITSLLFTQSALLGVYQTYFQVFPKSFTPYSIHVFSGLSGIFGIFFATQFIQTQKNTPRIHTLSYFIYIGYLTSILMSIVNKPEISHIISAIFGGFSSIYLLISAIIISILGYRPAKFFLIAWTIFLFGLFIYILRDIGILPFNTITTFTIPLGSVLESILLSFALADRINTLKKEKEINQKRIYDEMRRSRDLLNTQKMSLEKMVADRTQSLAVINENLNNTLKNLRETQAQLIDSEKMASLGQLTAGIAHEINNPINFVSSNIQPLKQDIKDILTILYKYNEFAQNHNFPELSQIQKEAELLNLEYSIQEIEQLIQGISEGANRTSTIVNSLKTFSRADRDEVSLADINAGLESTLTILKSQIANINLAVNYGKLPEIICFPGKLNQVFMNVLDNSIDAIHHKFQNYSEGKISIQTYQEEGNIFIEISDNGNGIPVDVQNKIFEPFFTTKEVGHGTGLGLSISYGIIENHKGKILVNSTPGSGTTVVIRIPIST